MCFREQVRLTAVVLLVILHILGLMVSCIFLGRSLNSGVGFDGIVKIGLSIVFNILGLIGISSLLCYIGVCGTCGKTREMRIITVIFAIILFLADLVGLGLVIAIFPGVVQKYMHRDRSDETVDFLVYFGLLVAFLVDFILVGAIWLYFFIDGIRDLQLNELLVAKKTETTETVDNDGIPNRAVILDVEIEECAEHNL